MKKLNYLYKKKNSPCKKYSIGLASSVYHTFSEIAIFLQSKKDIFILAYSARLKHILRIEVVYEKNTANLFSRRIDDSFLSVGCRLCKRTGGAYEV